MIVTLDDDVIYDPKLVESLVKRMPKDAGAVGSFCEVRNSPSSDDLRVKILMSS